MILLAALALATSSTHARAPLARIGDCSWVHGRYRLANGSRVHRIWIIGTDHIVNLDVDDSGAPPPLKRFFDRKKYEPTRDSLYADFYLCARTPRIRGHMQRVHLEKLKNVRIVTYMPRESFESHTPEIESERPLVTQDVVEGARSGA